MRATESRRGRVPLVVLGVAVACALVGWVGYSIAFGGIKEWNVDAQGPVLVSADGRTLTLTGVPDPAWTPEDCFGSLTVDVVTEEHAATVAVHFHLGSAPQEQGGPRGSCAQFTGIEGDLAHPLGMRTLTDAHGRPLQTVSEATAPRPRDPGLTEEGSELCSAARPRSQPGVCRGSLALVRFYRDTSGQTRWMLYQSLDPTAPEPDAPGTPGTQRTAVNGAPAVCRSDGDGGVVVDWTAGGTAQQLEFSPPSDSGATADQLCTQAVAEARTVS
ncbi:hypothetical protein C7C46_07380 [Streptomyces tateyamensis]|uniref:Uncharacterized protein n=1 Tax=Streptomyces tateyamensis TaxID=565073 RepID=A0A2V4NHP2_9ACTN|nr:hypothetical protein [Streptomyces tateyamensis]PYC84724.1 hypothetical protein C7C46_07380 [Streptomyces tateyamensis]